MFNIYNNHVGKGQNETNSYYEFLKDNLLRAPESPTQAFSEDDKMLIEDIATAHDVDVAIPATTLLSAGSALIGRSTALVSPFGNKVYAAFWCAHVAPNGYGKTHAINAIIDPLNTFLNIEVYRVFREVYHDFDHLIPSTYVTSSSTFAGLENLLVNDDHGILYYPDELTRLGETWKSEEKRSVLLTAYNVGDCTRVLANAIKTIPYTYISILGGIQPKMVNRFFSKLDVARGLAQRFVFVESERTKPCCFPRSQPTLSEESKCRCFNLIVGLFKRLGKSWGKWPHTINMSNEAVSLYGDWFNLMSKREYSLNKTTATGVYEKMKDRALRFALLFNQFDSATELQYYPVSLKNMSQAIMLANWLVKEQMRVWGKYFGFKNPEATPEIAMLKAIALNEEEIKVNGNVLSNQRLFTLTRANIDINLTDITLGKLATKLKLKPRNTGTSRSGERGRYIPLDVIEMAKKAVAGSIN